MSLLCCASLLASGALQAPVVGRAELAARAPQPLATASRRALLTSIASLGVASATPAWAGYVTSLGIETTKPQDAEKDDELLGSKAVQDGLSAIKKYRSSAAALSSQFEKDTNMNLIPVIRKDFDFSALRNDLNTITTVFDDQTQLTTDRAIRAILYDVTELENASRIKKGETERTPKKIANVQKWFAKLDKDFADLLAYY